MNGEPNPTLPPSLFVPHRPSFSSEPILQSEHVVSEVELINSICVSVVLWGPKRRRRRRNEEEGGNLHLIRHLWPGFSRPPPTLHIS